MKAELYDTYRNIEATHWWFVVRRLIVEDILKKYDIGKNAGILDVGSNWGFFVGELQKQGFINTSGTDISEEAIRYGSERGIKNLSASKAERLPFTDARFDLTMALDVVEHIKDDRAVLGEMSRVTKSGGYSFIMVPAYMFLWSLQDEVAQHERRYTKKSFAEAISGSGFEVVRSTYFNTLLFIPIVAIRFLERCTKINRSSDFDLNNAFTNAVLKFIFGLERYALRLFNFPFGVSLLIILKKK